MQKIIEPEEKALKNGRLDKQIKSFERYKRNKELKKTFIIGSFSFSREHGQKR